MANSSTEGKSQGLAWIPGSVVGFKEKEEFKLDVPHMGWNTIKLINNDEPLFKDIENPSFYFLHSYRFKPNSLDHVVSHTKYGTKFVSSIRSKNIWGTQFHPEKSHHSGIKLLDNFSKI